MAFRPKPIEAHVDMHVADPGQRLYLAWDGLRGIRADADRQPGTDDGLADLHQLGLDERFTPCQRHSLDSRPQEPGNHRARNIGQAHMVSPVPRRDETVSAVKIAALSNLNERLTLGSLNRGPEIAGTRVTVDDERTLHDGSSLVRPEP
ncbi:hypothetical protein Acor_21490 [Acrocarpospora corrugata]|uniref:Uncharacterized protein n=1 Tax=Acrocarpospora corrugata TaxID=35763 RepID=A0A5M3VU35_9ACTN|nr:hypothetical protein Acor_21490 [Acrocarpospora corrugata]